MCPRGGFLDSLDKFLRGLTASTSSGERLYLPFPDNLGSFKSERCIINDIPILLELTLHLIAIHSIIERAGGTRDIRSPDSGQKEWKESDETVIQGSRCMYAPDSLGVCDMLVPKLSHAVFMDLQPKTSPWVKINCFLRFVFKKKRREWGFFNWCLLWRL